jgi:glycosyltransferase involved in cell wall biosynthesis
MKVLWFSNNPALGNSFLNKDSKLKGTGGWMYTLNDAIKEKTDLYIAFHYPYKKESFRYKNTHFHPIYTGHIIAENLKKRFFGKVYDAHFLEQYIQIIKEVKPDVIHIHGTENSYLCLLGQVSTPIVISIQGILTVCCHKYFSGFHGKYLNINNENTSIKSLLFGKKSFGKDFKIMKAMAKIEQKQLKLATNIIGRTEWDRRITRVLAPKSVYYVGNEILRNCFYEKKWNNEYVNGKIIIFTTNGNNYYKGFETICYAISLLNDLNYEIEWRVAGVSNNSLINKITKKNLGSKYPKNGMLLLGSIDEEELIKNLLESNIYNMSSHIENSPNNLCEAMILGIPCIATFSGGTASMLLDREEGILIQDGDPWALAGAILEMLNNKEKAIKMGEKARERALLRHNREKIVSDLLEIYLNILNNK